MYYIPAPLEVAGDPAPFEVSPLHHLQGDPAPFEGELYPSNLKDISVPKRDKFKAPTISEVAVYSREVGLLMGLADCNGFVDYYESVGWVVGRSRKPMKSWRAAARRWGRENVQTKENSKKTYKAAE